MSVIYGKKGRRAPAGAERAKTAGKGQPKPAEPGKRKGAKDEGK